MNDEHWEFMYKDNTGMNVVRGATSLADLMEKLGDTLSGMKDSDVVEVHILKVPVKS